MIVGESLQMLRYTGHIRFKPHFLETEASVGYEDVKLISTNKSVFNMNPLIFASISNLCYRILEESESDNGSIVIHTELSDLELYKICKFATTGKFYRYKQPTHPHTNMAKAALNMMTRTSADDLARNSGIFMNSVDTGWINDENPLPTAQRIAQEHGFQTPIDEVDAAARILDPVVLGVRAASSGEVGGEDGCKAPLSGCFLKDYGPTEW